MKDHAEGSKSSHRQPQNPVDVARIGTSAIDVVVRRPIPTESNSPITVVIVSYNTKEMLLDCVDSLYSTTRSDLFNLAIIDNASVDGSCEAALQAYPNAAVYQSRENLGFAKANNYLVSRVRTPYVLLLNPDTLVLENAIENILNFALEKPDYRIWGGRTLFSNGELNTSSAWRRMTFWNQFCSAFGIAKLFPNSPIFNSEAYGGWDRSGVRSVDIVSGCFFFIQADFWKKLGGFRDKYFMYGEEADLCIRATMEKANPHTTDSATIVHFGGASEKTRSSKVAKVLRAKAELMLDHWGSGATKIGIAMLMIRVCTRWWGYSALAKLRPETLVLAEEAETWKEVWRMRNLWRNGFEE